jgi:hypothetical protein
MRHCLRPGIVTRHELSEKDVSGIFTPEEIAKFCRDMRPDAKPAAKPWVNPTPWKRGRKSQRMGA